MQTRRVNASKPTLAVLVFAVCAATMALSAGAQGWEPVLTGTDVGLFPDGTIDAPFRVTTDPNNPNVIYIGTGVIPTPGEPPPAADGLWKSSDGGDTWVNINEAAGADPDRELTSDTSILDISVCADDSNVVAVATNPKGFFLSEDAGSTWSYISDTIVHGGDASEPDHCAAIQHSDQTFANVDGRWAASTIAFDQNNCDIMYAGVADLNAIDIGAGTGDHPGMYHSADRGLNWTELNGNLEPRVDAIDCHVLTLTSQTFAPISAEVGPSGEVFLVSTDQEADASLFGKNATTQLRIWSHPGGGTGDWTQVSNGLNSSSITQTAGFGELVAVSVSAGFISISPTGSFFLSSHLGINTKITLGGTDVTYASKGIYASLDTSQWFPRDVGIPVANDSLTDDAQNVVGGPAINPNNPAIWLAGTAIQDGAGADASQVYGSPNFGASWANASSLFPGLSNSPTLNLPEASIYFIEWDSNGQCAYASVVWDFRGETSTADDGVYRVCL